LDTDIDAAADIVSDALGVYRQALSDGVSGFLHGRSIKPTMRPLA
jgi:hypothetical protein